MHEAAIALHIFKRERYVNYKLWEVGTAGFMESTLALSRWRAYVDKSFF
jgi:hypothetical protein